MSALPLRGGLLTILFKQQKIALGIFLTIVLGGLFYLTFAQRKYESSAELIVRFGNRSVPDVDRSPATELTPADRREIVLSHAAILGSPDLASSTIKAFGVEHVYPDIVSHPPSRWSVMDEAVRQFNDNLWVGVGTQDNVITVSFLHPDKVLAQKVVQKLIDLYNSQQTTVYHDPHSDFLRSEVSQAAQRLETAQNGLEAFKAEWRINDYDQEIEDLIKQRTDIDSSLHTAKASLDQARHRQADIEKLMQTVPKTVPESVNGEQYRSLDDAQMRLADLENKKSQMLATYAPNAPALTALNAGIASARAQLQARKGDLARRSAPNVNTVYQTLQTDYLRAAADAASGVEPVQVLTGQINAIDQRLGDLRKARGEFDNRMRERELAEDLYRSLTQQFEDARVKDSLNQQRISSVAVISAPSLPYKTARPRYLVTLLATLFASAILAIWGALMWEAKDDRFTTPEQLAAFLDLPVFAVFDRTHKALPGTSLPAPAAA